MRLPSGSDISMGIALLGIMVSGSLGALSAYASYILCSGFALLLIYRAQWQRLKIPAVNGRFLLLLYAVFAWWACATLLWAVDFRLSLSPAIQLVVLVLLLTGIALFLQTYEDYLRLLRWLALIGASAGLILAFEAQTRLSRAALLGGPNSMGVQLATSALAGWFHWRLTRQVTSGVAAGVCIVGIAATFSARSAVFLVVVFAVSMLAEFLLRASLHGVLRATSTFAVLILAFVVASAPATQERVVRLQPEGFALGYIVDIAGKFAAAENAERVLLYRAGVDIVGETQPLGRGFESSRVYLRQRLGVATYTHNNALELLIGGGVVAFGLYSIFLAAVMVRAFQAAWHGSVQCAATALGLVAGVVALGWTMALYANFLVTVLLFVFYSMLSRSGIWSRLEARLYV